MFKKILKFSALFLILLILTYIIIYTIQTYLIKKSLLNYVNSYDTTMLIDQNVVRCSYNVFNSEVAYIELSKGYYIKEDFSIYYHYLDNIFNIDSNDWEKNYIGGADIKNTTFPELVKMVKEDCSQFQQSKGDFNDKTINWSYSEYVPEPPEPQLTEDEIAIQKELEEIKRQKSIENRKDYKPIEFKIINE